TPGRRNCKGAERDVHRCTCAQPGPVAGAGGTRRKTHPVGTHALGTVRAPRTFMEPCGRVPGARHGRVSEWRLDALRKSRHELLGRSVSTGHTAGSGIGGVAQGRAGLTVSDWTRSVNS